MKTIKVDKHEYPLNNWDYFYNGTALMMVVNTGKMTGKILNNVPKKYWNDILFENHKTVDCGVTNTMPQMVSTTLRDTPYKIIIMDR
jgi:hypothetical protein